MGNFFDTQVYRANFTPLTPLSFLDRAALVYPDAVAISYGPIQQTWRETSERCRRFASALQRKGIGVGDVVAIIAPNIPAMYEAHFGVPMSGAVLNALNTRLRAEEIAFQLSHSGARMLLVDSEFRDVVAAAVGTLECPPILIDIFDDMNSGSHIPLGECEYEALLAQGDPEYQWRMPEDEREPIALNYTSGTTGDPKGVVTHHRGAHLNALAQIIAWSMPQNPAYLWTLPMFHCNGWCFPWAMAAQGGTNICLRRVDPPLVLGLIERHRVSHMCGAPIVYSMLLDEANRQGVVLTQRVEAMIAGAAPPRALIESGDALGFEFTHVYGLTEVYGPAAVCTKQPQWRGLSADERARLNARQGVPMLSQEAVAVLDPETMEPVPADGMTVGEIMFRGNATMSGYLKNTDATALAFRDGWFHTGDLAVLEPDNYVRITDRSKDVIISGGENISSLEVEDILHKHPAVSLAAVVAKPHPRWGEVPCAFIELREGAEADHETLNAYCRQHLAGFKAPKHFIFAPIPKTSTGKVQKFTLRQRAIGIGESAQNFEKGGSSLG